jgi:hypothetical protein
MKNQNGPFLSFLLTFYQAIKHGIYLMSTLNQNKPRFIQRNLPKSSQNLNTKSVREICVVTHGVYLKITNSRFPHERGAPESSGPDCVSRSNRPKAGLDHGRKENKVAG